MLEINVMKLRGTIAEFAAFDKPFAEVKNDNMPEVRCQVGAGLAILHELLCPD